MPSSKTGYFHIKSIPDPLRDLFVATTRYNKIHKTMHWCHNIYGRETIRGIEEYRTRERS